jgi:predicted  nucleic acid-binding Zn-ribbon protein
VLGELADRLQDQGDVMGELRALDAAAQANRDRVAHLQKGTISEVDRTNVLRTWTKILQQVDAAQVRVKAIRDKILAAISELRRRQVGLAEEILAGSYEDAIKSLNEWLSDLQKTIDKLRASVASPGV